MTLRAAAKNHKKPSKNRNDLRKNRKPPDPVNGLSGWQVAALAVVAVVIITTLMITNSPEAVKAATIPLLIALAVLVGRRYLGRPDE